MYQKYFPLIRSKKYFPPIHSKKALKVNFGQSLTSDLLLLFDVFFNERGKLKTVSPGMYEQQESFLFSLMSAVCCDVDLYTVLSKAKQ